jgi:uncharacterized cupredoxin-like copper-binding protein
MRRRAYAAAGALLLIFAGAALLAAVPSTASASRTVHITIHFSHFDLESLSVHPGETVRFVITNTDPIDHEFIVGDEAVQVRHENGTEPSHGLRPGEVSVPAGTTQETTYTFPATPVPIEFACHLPGHYAYGMHGPISITSS